MENIETLATNNEQGIQLTGSSEILETKTAESIEKEETTLDNNEEKTVEKEVEHYFTNEATKAVACMLRDVITDYELAKEMDSDAENIGKWGYDKILPQINMLQILPEEWRKYKLAIVLKNFVNNWVVDFSKIKRDRFPSSFVDMRLPRDYKPEKGSFHSLYVVLAKVIASYADYESLADYLLNYENYSGFDEDDERSKFHDFWFIDSDHYFWSNEETKLVANHLEDYFYIKERDDLDDKYSEDCFSELVKRFSMIDMIPNELRLGYMVDLIKRNVINGLPSLNEIDPVTGECSLHKCYDLMLVWAYFAYCTHVDFVNIAEEFLKDGLKSLKGLRETYPNF